MATERRRWTREETIICLDLYFRIPSSKTTSRNPEVIKIAKLINRTPDSVNLKVHNFTSLDDTLIQKGLGHTSNLDREVWEEFQGDYYTLIDKTRESRELFFNEDIYEKENQVVGIDVSGYVPNRRGQKFFRESILASYNESCCITGLKVANLLIASHIKSWKESTKHERVDPQNGLCLNALHDKAFDRGLITVSTDYKIRTSERLKKHDSKQVKEFFMKYEGLKIDLPERLPPDKDFLDWHEKNIFIR
ncbi:MAG: HNH endonuclease [Thermodesulfobacteriota bacterium]